MQSIRMKKMLKFKRKIKIEAEIHWKKLGLSSTFDVKNILCVTMMEK